MKTLEMEIALMQSIGVRDKLIVPNVHWGMRPGNSRPLHECDLLVLSESGYATEIEIKVSKSDLMADAKKPHGHRHAYIKYLYYAVPIELKEAALEVIPATAGLYIVKPGYKYKGTTRYNVRLVRQASNSGGKKWGAEDRYQLARLGTLRILSLKEKIWRHQKK